MSNLFMRVAVGVLSLGLGLGVLGSSSSYAESFVGGLSLRGLHLAGNGAEDLFGVLLEKKEDSRVQESVQAGVLSYAIANALSCSKYPDSSFSCVTDNPFVQVSDQGSIGLFSDKGHVVAKSLFESEFKNEARKALAEGRLIDRNDETIEIRRGRITFVCDEVEYEEGALEWLVGPKGCVNARVIIRAK